MPEATIETLKSQVEQLQRQVCMLSNSSNKNSSSIKDFVQKKMVLLYNICENATNASEDTKFKIKPSVLFSHYMNYLDEEGLSRKNVDRAHFMDQIMQISRVSKRKERGLVYIFRMLIPSQEPPGTKRPRKTQTRKRQCKKIKTEATKADPVSSPSRQLSTLFGERADGPVHQSS